MKIFSLIAAGLFIFAAACNNLTDEMEVTGTIHKQEITSYQYGTHTLTTPETFYAIRSAEVDLSAYEGHRVTVKAEKVEGYPIEGGPEYLEVKEIKKVKE